MNRILPRTRPLSLGWLTLGLGIKRWALVTVLGIILVVLGAALAFAYVALDFSLNVVAFLDSLSGRFLDSVALGTMLLTTGVVAIVFGVRGVFQAVERVYANETHRDFLDVARTRKRLDSAERVVALGGGTGLSTMLRGLKEHSSNITAIVTMADDGGSTGKLREHGMLPPGDLRNCIAALAEAEPLMTELFQYRFQGLGELKGHSLGNLFMAAMFEKTGDFDLAVREVSKVLAIRGRVLPSTLDDVRLGAELQDHTEILGQVNVNKASNIARAFIIPDNPRALPGAVEAIEEAEVIIIGPGSLFTSIIPNLLVPEIAEAIKKSDAPKIYVCNVMTQPEETCGYSAADHVRAIIRHIGAGVVTHVLLNSAKVPDDVLERYSAIGAEYIPPEETEIEMMGVRAIHGPFIDVSNVVRHHPGKLAAAIFRIAARV
ncbi:gluconeogenesis factor [Abditibacteriota bacterium]|nr:gluconeogenesis factor [Abditibacteriota bacterium]